MERPVRIRTEQDYRRNVPVHVVWEITLACDLKCMHCGSRAGRRRVNELNTEECLDVVEQLARLGTREVSLIGGEAYLRSDWIEIIRAFRAHDIYCAIQTGGRNLTDRRLADAVEAGLQGVGVSIDGLAARHDRIRRVPGAYDTAMGLLHRAKAAGLKTSVSTQIGSGTAAELPALMERFLDVGVTHWQMQLTVAMGNAVDNDALLLQPYELLDLMPRLAELYRSAADRNLLIVLGNNLGYFGPYEHLWRGFGDESQHWSGCVAGHTGIGLEADGTVKGCPSLATNGFAGGNVRDLTLEDIWNSSPEIHFTRTRSVDDLWGYCRTCYYADVCRGGCTWTAHSLLGRAGNNPYCHHRAIEFAKLGLRERVEKKRDAPDTPFSTGEFALIVEPIPGHSARGSVEMRQGAEPHRVPLATRSEPGEGCVPPHLDLCRGCDHYIWPDEVICPHCGTRIAEAATSYADDKRRRDALVDQLRGMIESAKAADASPSVACERRRLPVLQGP